MTNEQVQTAIAIREETSAVMLTNQQLTMIANTSFVPAAFRGKVPEVLACVATGRALGLPDMTSLRGINVIEGKATLSAELMTAIVRSHGHSITGSSDDQKAVVKGKRVDNSDTMTATFTIQMAERAGLLAKKGSAWKSYPEAMLWARAVSQLCRMLFADCFAGATYVPEEMEATADEVMDETQPVSLEVTETDIQLGLAEPDGMVAGENPAHPNPGPETPSGTASSWAEVKEWCARDGISDEFRGEVCRDLFPGMTPGELNPVDFARLWLAIRERSGAEVA